MKIRLDQQPDGKWNCRIVDGWSVEYQVIAHKSETALLSVLTYLGHKVDYTTTNIVNGERVTVRYNYTEKDKC